MDIDYHIYRFKYLFGQYLPLKTPVDVSLELASTCDLRCAYCYHADQKNLPFMRGHMTWETAQKIIYQAAELGVNSLKMNWKGESTQNPYFERICRYAAALARPGVFIERITNSNFNFDTKRNDIFEGLKHQTKVKVSFDSFKKEVFEAQRIKGKWDRVFTNIKKFNDMRENTELIIQSVRTKLNKYEDLKSESEKHFPGAKISIRDVVEGRVEKDIDNLAHRKRGKDRKPCKQAFVRLIFNHDGVASPCCPDIKEELQVGSIHDMSLKDIFNSEKARQLRSSLKSGQAFLLNPCLNCSSFESYKNGKVPYHS